MVNFLGLLFQDIVLLIATLILVATVIILAWALKALKEYVFGETPSLELASETAQDFDLKVGEISKQLARIDGRLENLEKIIKIKKTPDDAVSNPASSKEFEEKLANIQSQIEALAKQQSSEINVEFAPEEKEIIAKIENKLENMQALLEKMSKGTDR